MRIEIKSKDHSFKLILPTALLLNPIGFSIAKKQIKIQGLDLSSIKGKDISEIARIIKKCKKSNPDWYLVDIEDSSGDVVRIKM